MEKTKKMLTFLPALFFFLFSFNFTSADEGVFKYIDKNGTILFTDSYESIPEQYRNQIKIMKEPRPLTLTQPVGEREEGNGAALRKEIEEEIKEMASFCKELAHKNLDQSARMNQDELMGLLILEHFCTEPEISARLDTTERNRIQDMAKRFQELKKSLPEDKLANLEQMFIYAKTKWKEEVRKRRIY